METEHAETVVEKAVALVKDMLGAERQPVIAHRPLPEHDLSTDEAQRLEDPHAYTFNKIVERSRATAADEKDVALLKPEIPESPREQAADEQLLSESEQAKRSANAQESEYWTI